MRNLKEKEQVRHEGEVETARNQKPVLRKVSLRKKRMDHEGRFDI